MTEKILIVDDDVDSLKLIGLMLKRKGYEVVVADSGSKGLAKVEAEKPDLMILDVMMPDMNGLEVAKRIRKKYDPNTLPIIMFTAKTLIDDKLAGFEAGVNVYLTKPTHPNELATHVKSLLQQTEGKANNAAPGGTPRRQGNARGMLVAVMGVKGGVGTTTVAVNTAAVLQRSGENPILADFRIGNGTIGLMLGAQQNNGVPQLLNAPEISPASIEPMIFRHQSGLRALVSSANPRDMVTDLPGQQMRSIANALRMLGNPAIIDLGNGAEAINNPVIREADKVLVVVESNSVALDLAIMQLRDIEGDVGGGRISVVIVNRSQTSLPWHEVENRLGREVRAIISPAPELAHQALETRTPMVLMQPGAMVSGQFSKLAEDMKSRIRSLSR